MPEPGWLPALAGLLEMCRHIIGQRSLLCLYDHQANA